MREMGFLYWRWAAVGALMGMLGLMIALGLGRRRGTRLHSIRIGLWVMVVTLGGAGVAETGCSERGGESDAKEDGDATDPAGFETFETCYLDTGWDSEDTGGGVDSDPMPDTSRVECYVPWDPLRGRP